MEMIVPLFKILFFVFLLLFCTSHSFARNIAGVDIAESIQACWGDEFKYVFVQNRLNLNVLLNN